jgi:amino acid transporter
MVCACYIRFKQALAAQGIDRRNLLLRGWFQPYMAWTCVFMFTIILVFNGFGSFIHSFSVSDFFASYITLPVFALAVLGFRFFAGRARRPVGMAPLDEIDLSHGPEQALRGTRYDLAANVGLVQNYVKDT